MELLFLTVRSLLCGIGCKGVDSSTVRCGHTHKSTVSVKQIIGVAACDYAILVAYVLRLLLQYRAKLILVKFDLYGADFLFLEKHIVFSFLPIRASKLVIAKKIP